MAGGLTAVEGDALDSIVVGIVERAIGALQAIGMTHEAALRLLTIQATIRMHDAKETKQLLQSIMKGLDDSDDNDDSEPFAA